MKNYLLQFIFIISSFQVFSQLSTGAEQTEEYFKLIANKKIGLVVNQTSIIKKEHLVDSLLSANFSIEIVFAPEHGFRGTADAGEHVKNHIDNKTGLPIISLYGQHKKPSPLQLHDIDIMIFDIQDVGVRFYTYISTMHYIMEACAENNIPVIILDRPNPNGNYVAGPVLNPEFKSFVGMHPIPIVHGLTVGELAQMINQEHWLKNKVECNLTIIPCKNYTHKTVYKLPVKPSPNLPNAIAIKLYPTLCLLEPTAISIGRGTTDPFQIAGLPNGQKNGEYSFMPKSIVGMSKHPKYENEICYGLDLRNSTDTLFSLKPLMMFYKNSVDKDVFFTNPKFFNLLVGDDLLIKQIKKGVPIEDIQLSWEPQLQEYLLLRSKYLLYPDFD